MAKTPAKPEVTEDVSTATASSRFKYDMGLEIPAQARAAARKTELAEAIEGMPVGASYLEEIKASDIITDEGERAKDLADRLRKASNRVSGLLRRLRDKNPELSFELRTVNDANLGTGIRVWRK